MSSIANVKSDDLLLMIKKRRNVIMNDYSKYDGVSPAEFMKSKEKSFAAGIASKTKEAVAVAEKAIVTNSPANDVRAWNKDGVLLSKINCGGANIPARFYDCTFKQLKNSVSIDNARAFNLCMGYANNISANISKGYGLILMGGVGAGKTSTAVAVLQEAIKKDFSAMFVNMTNFIDDMFSLKEDDKVNRGAKWHSYEEKLIKAKILVLDDLGGERTSNEFVRAKIEGILTKRYDSVLSTIVTTNSTVQGLCELYSDRVIDRLQETSVALSFGNTSYRKGMTVDKLIDYSRQGKLDL